MASQESGRRSAPRGKNFNKAEDRQICVSWVYVTQDSIQGTDRSVSSFWIAVMQNAKASTPSIGSRTWDAIRQRFNSISRSVMKFGGCVKAVHRLNKSGTSAVDHLNMAHELFQKEQKTEFKFIECYEILKLCPKFHMNETTKKLSPEANVSSPDPATPLTRPIGQKQAKAKLRIEEADRSKLDVLKLMAESIHERNDIMRHSNRIKIVTTSLNDLDEISAKIIMMEKRKILAELQSRSELCDPLTSIQAVGTHQNEGMINDDFTDLFAECSSAKRIRVECMMDGTRVFNPDELIVTDEESE